MEGGQLEPGVPADRVPVATIWAGAGPAAPTRLTQIRALAAARGVPLSAILVTVGVVVFTYLAGKLVYRLRDVILRMVVAGFIALILNPFLVGVQRWVPHRGSAVAIVTVCAILVFAVLVAGFGYPLAIGLTHLSHRLPGYIHDAAGGQSWIGHLVRRLHLTAWVNRYAPNLEILGAKLARPALSFGKGAASAVAALAAVAALVLLLLLEGPAMRRGVLGAMSPGRAERYTRVGHRRLSRRVFRRLRGRAALHSLRGHPAGHRQGNMARDRAWGTARRCRA